MREVLFRRRLILNRHIFPARYISLLAVTLLLVCAWSLWPPQHIYRPPLLPPLPVVLPHTTSHTSSLEWSKRAQKVKDAFLHAYEGYEKHASPHDELKPMWNTSVDNFNGWGVTMVDSLSTMLLMGLDNEFARALPVIEKFDFVAKKQLASGKYDKPNDVYVPFFETVIRYLGGLLSAHALSNEPILLQKADELASKLAPAFNTTSGLPAFGVNTITGMISGSQFGMLAEIASCQVEYAYLAHATGKAEHYARAGMINEALQKVQTEVIGMLPTQYNLTNGLPTDRSLSLGGGADSGHEYLLKYYLLTGQTDQPSLNLYMRTVNHILTNLMYITPNRGLLYVTPVQGTSDGSRKYPMQTFEHLACFLPGMLALGVHSLPRSAFSGPLPRSEVENHKLLRNYDLRELHLWAAEGLGESCWLMYADQPSGLGPEQVFMNSGLDDRQHPKDIQYGGLWIDMLERWRTNNNRKLPPGLGDKLPFTQKFGATSGDIYMGLDYTVRRSEYLLRPETIESMYILWKTTGNPKWRERGWEIFKALEREAKLASGYASLKSVLKSPAPLKDEMPSYFLAETLKYLYLLFSDKDPVPLERWVFNTEAHPLPIFSWSSSEKQKFGIH